MKSFLNKKISFAFIFSSIIYLIVRLLFLGQDILNSDGARWYRRSSNFLSAITNGNFIETYQHYQPGVTLMWIRSAAEKVTWIAQDFLKMPHWYMENYAYFLNIHLITKVVLVLVLFSIFLYQAWLVKNIFGEKVALIFSILMALEPYLVGIDRWFHLTSLETYFSFSCFLTALYWNKISVEGRKPYWLLILSGALLALSVLSKVTGFITLISVVFIIFNNFWKNRTHLGKFKVLINIGIFITTFGLTFYILFPALWQDPVFVYEKIINPLRNAAGLENVFNVETALAGFLYYPKVLLFKLSPTTVILFLASILYAIRKRNKVTAEIFLAILYLGSYYLLLSLASKKIDRYCLEFILPIILFVSVFISQLNRKILVTIALVVFFTSVYVGFNNFPVMSGFYSPLFGGENIAIKNGIYDNSGEYFAQAAFYLNKYEPAKVYILNNYESFKFFSKHEILPEMKGADYALFSLDSLRRDAPEVYCGPLEESFGPRFDKPVVYVYKCDATP